MSWQTYTNSRLTEHGDDTTRTVTTYSETGAVTSTRPYTADENAAADQAAAQAVLDVNRQALSDVAKLDSRLARLAAYATDADLLAVLAQTNNQALPTATLNRALKTLVRENRRQSATIALLVRLIDPELLATVTDTADA